MKRTTSKLYKVLGENGEARMGLGKWHLPKEDGTPGQWMPPIEGKLIPCQNGYHLCQTEDLVYWLGPAIFEAEHRGEMLITSDKVVVREARITRKLLNWPSTTQRLFAADCAEHVLHLFEARCPQDDRPRKAIEATRAFARGEVDRQTLRTASAYAFAASVATVAAASASAYAASVASYVSAVDAVDAVAAAAYAADAVAFVAYAAEREWQTQRLFEYLEDRA